MNYAAEPDICPDCDNHHGSGPCFTGDPAHAVVWDYNPITALRVAAAQNVDAATRVARHTSLRQAANETGEAFVRRITVAMLEEMGG